MLGSEMSLGLPFTNDQWGFCAYRHQCAYSPGQPHLPGEKAPSSCICTVSWRSTPDSAQLLISVETSLLVSLCWPPSFFYPDTTLPRFLGRLEYLSKSLLLRELKLSG